MTSSSVSQKNDPELGQPPRSQQDLETDYPLERPSNLAARTLSLAEHTLSKLSGDPCPVRRGIVAAVKCYVRKARFVRFCSTEREKPEPFVGFNTTQGKICLGKVLFFAIP